MPPSTPDLLEAIMAATRRRVALRQQHEGRDVIEARAMRRAPAGERFRQAIAGTERMNIIAECKRRSPARGVLRAAYDPVAIARAYEGAGAAAISVLTEPAFFDGHLDDLARVRQAVQVPLLRKDFICDEYQLLEARAAGADAVLLIVSALGDVALQSLCAQARDLGLATLVEIHDAAELDRALGAGATLVGVNNRNLRTLAVDLTTSEQVAARLPRGVVAVSESGLRTPADLFRLRALGYTGFLVGERFMTAEDPGEALASLLRATSVASAPAQGAGS
jgi:indole-3-glycerol phosphate synthase